MQAVFEKISFSSPTQKYAIKLFRPKSDAKQFGSRDNLGSDLSIPTDVS